MPGFSRSIAPATAFDILNTPRPLSIQIVGLMGKLFIESAHVYGCSSGGVATLGLVADHPTRVLSAIVHEVPMGNLEQLDALVQLEDASIAGACNHIFGTLICSNPEAWAALGPEYHVRLGKNYVIWVRKYVARKAKTKPLTDDEYKHRPITWTIGALNPAASFFENVTTAVRNGIEISLLPCKHFPQVSIPDRLAGHIRASVIQMSKL